MALIEVRGLTKRYGEKEVLRGIDLDVEQGQIVGVLGPNGAGKTTAVECIGGLRERDGGTILVAGQDPQDSPRGFRDVVGMQLQQCRLPARLTPREVLSLFAAFYADPVPGEDLLASFGLRGQGDLRFDHLSGGQQQRLSVALALIGRPQIAILDELTTGLDPAARREIWGHLRRLREEGVTMMLVTHSMEEVAALCDHVVILDGGRIIARGSPAELSAGLSRTSFEADLSEATRRRLADLPGVSDVRGGPHIVVEGDADSPATIIGALLADGVAPRRLRVEGPSLDEAYLRLTEAS
ncbi:MAG: ABC transporter ATP-binding protein [Mobilicoccus sp.]|nr:ABC transporter ATP-binding protein [Mobilicoccus sp.]